MSVIDIDHRNIRMRSLISRLMPALLCAVGAIVPLVGQAPQPATIPAAMAKLRAGDAEAAIAIMQAVVARDSSSPRAWRVLGSAEKQGGHFVPAVAAYTKALSIDTSATAALAMYGIGATYARSGNKDSAFHWLGRAKSTHRIDMSAIDADTELVALRSDARYAALQPVAADFANPIVEPVKIIREWDGESANDQFGWIARAIGDVDGDHVADFVTSAPTRSNGGASAGRVYVYSSRTGKLLWSVDGKPGDTLGIGIEAAGDVDHDGVPDVVASAPGAGKAYVYSGRDGHVLLTFSAENAADGFGTHVAGNVDVNGDGYPDLLVGAPANNANGKGAGRAYIYSGKNGSLLLTLTGERAGDAFGSTVAGASDRAHHVTIMVGAPGAGDNNTGRTYVYHQLQQTPSFTIESDSTGAALGAMFLSVPGDMDGDGVADVFASDWTNSARGPATGRVYINSGADGHRLYTLTGETPGDGFGTSSSVAGDVDGDGRADLIVGAWQYAGAAISGGRAYLYSGKDGHLIRTYTSRTPGDTFGFDAVGIGDVDGDGVVDLLITSAWSGLHGFHSGRVFIISSGVARARH